MRKNLYSLIFSYASVFIISLIVDFIIQAFLSWLFYKLSLKEWELRDEHFCKELFYVAAWASEGWRLVILIILLTFLGSWVLPFYVWHITSTKRTTIFYHVWHGKNLEPIAKKTALPGKANFGLYIDQKRSLIIFIYHKIRKPHIFHKKRLRDNEKW